MKSLLIGLSFFIILAGCVSAGKEVAASDIAAFEQGKTTITDVKKRLGEPSQSSIDGLGRQTLVYAFFSAKATPASYIPIVGVFAGGADTRNTVASFIFDRSGILEHSTYSQGQSRASNGD